MKFLKLTLCLLLLAFGAFATNLYTQIRETMSYMDSCGGSWTLIIHFTDQGSSTGNNNERADHYEALIDQVESGADC